MWDLELYTPNTRLPGRRSLFENIYYW